MALTIADTNEFHSLADAHAYAGSSPVVILRAHNGYREDYVYGANVRAAYGVAGLASIGHYGYLPGGVDAATAGVAFAETVKRYGGLRRQDFVACDLEEGAGDQALRMQAWLGGAHSVLGEQQAQEWGYSGAAFWTAHLGSSTVTHRWVAAYGQSAAPALGEALWQYTDSLSIAGVSGPCDGSTFAGTLAQFLALIGAGAPAPAIVPNPSPSILGREDDDMIFQAPNGAAIYVSGGKGAGIPDGADLIATQKAGCGVAKVSQAWFAALVAKFGS